MRRQFLPTGIGHPGYEAIAADWSCSDCPSDPAEVTRDDEGFIVRIVLRHQEGCPVLAGAVDPVPDIRRAIPGQPLELLEVDAED